jgi:MFS family permease
MSFNIKTPKKERVETFEELLDLTGGFGIFQLFVSLTLYLGFQTGGQIVYGMEFLTVYPEYECFIGGEWLPCDRKIEICDAGLPEDLWRIDYTADDSYKNWVDPDKLNLTCVPGYMIGLMGSFYFLGFAISAGITPTIGDRYGRKTPYTMSLVI